ncbi:MAG: CoA-binding protein [Acidobacteriaceae bacterium]
MNEPETIRTILEKTKIIAVIGLSDKPERPSHRVSSYMQQHGYRIIPVNPRTEHRRILGETVYKTLDDVVAGCGEVQLVNVFRASVFVPEIVKDVMRLKIPYLWLQQGVCHDEAAGWAEADGVKVVMDRCIMVERATLERR